MRNVKSSSGRTAAVEALAAKQLDFVLTGPAEYVVFRARTNAQPVVALTRPDYFSQIVVLADGPIKALGDLKGKKISFGEIGSTSQHLGPAQILMDAGLSSIVACDRFGNVWIANSGSSGALTVAWRAGRPGQPSMQYEITGSAYGGGCGNDGASGTTTHLSNLHITPIEILDVASAPFARELETFLAEPGRTTPASGCARRARTPPRRACRSRRVHRVTTRSPAGSTYRLHPVGSRASVRER